jgi:aflatoxin B1 aldehyde reductase
VADIKAGKGNYNPSTVLGKILQDQYGKDSYFRYLEKYSELATEAGLTKVGMAYRWVVWNSCLGAGEGDKIVLGASSGKQLDELVAEIEKGRLEDWIMKRLDDMWKDVEADAPEHNFATYKKLMKAGLL